MDELMDHQERFRRSRWQQGGGHGHHASSLIREVNQGDGIDTGVGRSQIKFDSYVTTHLGELWLSRDDQCP